MIYLTRILEPEQEIILNLVEKFGSDFYVGLKKKHWTNSSRHEGKLDDLAHNQWRWDSNNQTLSYTKISPWNNGKPSENKLQGNCARIEKHFQKYSFGLNDVKCSINSNIICEKNRK